MLIREIITTGRKLFAQCGNHFTSYRNEVDLTGLPLDMDHTELQGRVVCSRCGSRKVLLLPQTTRQVRQGRER